MPRIGVVGAGAGSAAVSYVVSEAVPDADLTVLEKSGGLCGRAATRRRDELTYDYGANYLKSDDERVNDLVYEALGTDGLVDASEPIYTFDADGTVSPGRDADEHKWSFDAGLTQIAKRLFGGTDATVHRRTRVETVRRHEASDEWSLVDTDGEQYGPFDALVMNPPAPQTAELLRTAEWTGETRDALLSAVEDVTYDPNYSAVLHYDDLELDVPYYALVNIDKDHDVGWIAREECKAGHVPEGETLLVVQASPAWADAHYDDPPAENVAELAWHAAEIVGDERLADPDWTDHQGWRYALPQAGVAAGPVDSAREAGLYCVGDWVAGEGRLHAALRNGLDVGERLVYGL